MARTCTACTHAERAALDAALVAGAESIRTIAHHFALSDDALKRHKRDHIPAALAAAKQAEDVAAADDLLGQVRALRGHAMDILMATKEADEPDYRTALSAIREVRGCIELFVKIREAEQLEERVAALEAQLSADATRGR